MLLKEKICMKPVPVLLGIILEWMCHHRAIALYFLLISSTHISVHPDSKVWRHQLAHLRRFSINVKSA
jgi:hypothetical protein